MRTGVARWLILILGACLIAVVAAWGWSRLAPSLVISHSVPPQNTKAQIASFTQAAPCTGTAKRVNIYQIFADVPPLQSGQYHLDELPGVFPAFQHRPFDSAGFNAVMLPFSYSDPNHLGDPNEAMALAALISNDLDWSPGCYCSRHAFFVFKRDPDLVQSLMQGYDPEEIETFIDHWLATNAIGGQLIQTPAGFEGKIEIFNDQGVQVYTKQYGTPRSYWDLLGDMDVDAMTFLDVKPSASLSDYLHQPRCKHFESVADLGSAALMEEKSDQEFAVYQKILQTDPGFSMVRHWYANQQHWNSGDDQFWAYQNGVALSYRIEPASLEEFNPNYCSDQNLKAQFPQWLDHAEALASTDCPFVIAARLRHQVYNSQSLDQILDRGLRVAAKYPNTADLPDDLAYATPDRFLAASLYAESILNKYLPGVGNKDDEKLSLAWAADQVGRDDVAMQLLSAMDPQQIESHLGLLLGALARAGCYHDAVQLYALIQPDALDESEQEQLAPWAAFAGFMTDNGPFLDRVLTEQKQALAALNLTDVFQQYADLFAGRQDGIASVGTNDARGYWNHLLYIQCDASAGKSTDHTENIEFLCTWPLDRLLRISEDFYQRRDPSDDGPSFYKFLTMFFSYDPWVASAVADFHKRGGIEKPVDSDQLLSDLQKFASEGFPDIEYADIDWKHIPTPWRVACAVDQLLKQGKPASAVEIAHLYLQYASAMRSSDQIAIAGELIRKATAALPN